VPAPESFWRQRDLGTEAVRTKDYDTYEVGRPGAYLYLRPQSHLSLATRPSKSQHIVVLLLLR
jgi:hypothetical protein